MLKTGDLVQLSAYGKKIKLLENYHGDVGLVLKSWFDSAQIHWNTSSRPVYMNRRDIKIISKVKK